MATVYADKNGTVYARGPGAQLLGPALERFWVETCPKAPAERPSQALNLPPGAMPDGPLNRTFKDPALDMDVPKEPSDQEA